MGRTCRALDPAGDRAPGLAWLLIRDEVTGGAGPCPFARLDRRHCCAVDGTPLATARDAVEATRTA
jgi:hypothetical protein